MASGKGKSKTACQRDDRTYWVEGHTRDTSNGKVKVSGHCREKSNAVDRAFQTDNDNAQ